MKLDYIEKWTGTYRGVNFEINQLHRDFRSAYIPDHWFTYYLHLNKERMLTDEYKKLSLRKKKYYPTGKMDSFFDFHGGCTYYERQEYGLKIGCDYHHLHDREHHYNVESIVLDVKKCIDYFLEKFTYLRWCGNCGEIVKLDEGKLSNVVDEGAYNFKCKKCADKKEPKEGEK